MSLSSPLRIALIGLGDIAQKAYLPIVANHPEIVPVLCTRDPVTRQRLGRQYRIGETYTDLDDLLRTQISAAMVHSATDSHFAIVSRLLRAGVPVFVDKPLTYTLAETETLLALAEQQRVLLYLGFNRRFVPLIQRLRAQPAARHISWQKHRVALPGEPRVFVLDDFIHVVDSLRFLGRSEVEDLAVVAHSHAGRLESIQVQWRQGDTLLRGAMNRVSGLTEERIEYFTPGHTWRLDSLTSGHHYTADRTERLGFGSWETTLYKRGFVPMIEDWLAALRADRFDPDRLEDIRRTHRLCEAILERV